MSSTRMRTMLGCFACAVVARRAALRTSLVARCMGGGLGIAGVDATLKGAGAFVRWVSVPSRERPDYNLNLRDKR